jgi:hypothetical protein
MMEYPRRIVDGGAGAWEKSVISSAALDAPSPEFRRHLAKKLGVALSGAGIAATTTSTAKAAVGTLWLKWMAVGIAVGLVGMGAASLATSRVSTAGVAPSAPVALTPATPTRTAKGIAPANDPVTPTPADPTPEATTVRGVPMQSSAPGANAANNAATVPAEPAPAGPLGTASFAAPGQSDLSAQTAVLQTVRASLAARRAEQALRQVDQYERDYPAGLFLLEAEVLRIDADSQLGDSASVKRLATRFLELHRDSPYARHVQALLDTGKNP